MKNFTSCFKDKKFLRFFFNNLRLNNTNRYKEFPFISLCGKERNYVRCDDYPFVFTHVITKIENGTTENYLSHNHAGDLLLVKFKPNRVYMLPETGRVYHPAPARVGNVGLIRSKLAIEFSKNFVFENGEASPPTHFSWNESIYKLENDWFKLF